MKNSEVAEGAIEVLERDGWDKGYYRTDQGYCMLGAGIKALGQEAPWIGTLVTTQQLQAINQVVEIFQPVTPFGRHHSRFNDAPLTSYDDVINLLTEAAKYWRDRGE